MPTVNVRNWKYSGFITDGEQTVNELIILGPVEIELDSTVYKQAGTYSLIRYTTFTGSQSTLNTFVTIIPPVGRNVTDAHGTLVSDEKRITVTLV